MTSVTRVGIGKQCVWERSVPGPGIELIHKDDPTIGKGSFFDAGWEPLPPGKDPMYREEYYVQVEPDEGAALVHLLEFTSGDQRSDDLALITGREHEMNHVLPTLSFEDDTEDDDESEE